MLSEQDLKLPLSDWDEIERSGRKRRWQNRAGDMFSFEFLDTPPDLPAPSNIDAVRSIYRQQLGVSGGIVEINATTVQSLLALAAIFKFPQSPSGMTYLGVLIIPFRDCSFVLKWQCPERGITGVRTAVVFDRVAPTLDNVTHLPVDWAADPYDPSYRNPILRNRADDVEWDATFPDHPLSHARSYLRTIGAIELSSRAEYEPPLAESHTT